MKFARLPVRTALLASLAAATSSALWGCSNDESATDQGVPGDGDGATAGDGDGDAIGDGDGQNSTGGGGRTVSGDGDGRGGASEGGNLPQLDAACADLALCGPDGKDDCCARVSVPGGSFLMGRGDDADACPAGQNCAPHELPEHDVVVDSFTLDQYEVTVGRFRAFVEAFDDIELAADEGAHPLIQGSGWLAEYAADLAADEEALRISLACDEDATWTDTPAENEALPINCVNWATAFAFCAAAEGRLPTEAEWEYAASGGDENRLYPWGSMSASAERASFFPSSIVRAGSLAAGHGRYENADLAGNVWEWALDWLDTGWYEGGGAECDNCARVTSGMHRVIRGGAYSYEEVTLRAATRSGALPNSSEAAIGFRCAYASN